MSGFETFEVANVLLQKGGTLPTARLAYATRGELNGIDVTCRVTGGAPGEQLVDEEVQLSSSGPVKAPPVKGTMRRWPWLTSPTSSGSPSAASRR